MSVNRFAFLVIFGVVALFGIIVFQNARINDGRLHVVFCDVGQGDGIFIRTPNQTDILVDAGPDDKILACLSRYMPFWDREIDAVILTHHHLDHYGGVLSVLKRYSVRYYYTQNVSEHGKNESLQKAILAEKNLSAKFLTKGDKFAGGDGVSLYTLWPGIEVSNKTDPNMSSVVLYLSFEDFQALLTGDINSDILGKVVAEAGDIEVLKVPHHGSRTGLNEAALETLKPELAVISVGRNSYGHPAENILKTLKDAGAKILRTDKNGEAEVISDGKSWFIKTQ